MLRDGLRRWIGGIAVLTLLFWLAGLFVGVMLFLQAYGWNWEWWKCLLFAAAGTVVTVLLLGACRSLVVKVIEKAGDLMAAVEEKLG